MDSERSQDGHDPLVEYFREEHGLFPRSYAHGSLDPLPDDDRPRAVRRSRPGDGPVPALPDALVLRDLLDVGRHAE
ncbi:hypothetical protein [Salinilacihabitans rarus]|uniref:hypothetical protein n=1 Tax=Salinilacihabitans rarus TaxID=2961596 RepID=UPI0020C86D34|nr:hypothetical protein [Salinilacihabitans rarus]